jgi:hypothetical protein
VASSGASRADHMMPSGPAGVRLLRVDPSRPLEAGCWRVER